MKTANGEGAGAVPEKRFWGHPIQLSTLFHIELWERFSYYGMQGILLIYLYYSVKSGGLGIDQNLAGSIVSVYGGSVFLTTILCGWLADRVLGPERTLFWSGWVVMAGHVVLAFIPGGAGLTLGLVLVAIGSGGVKSAASSLVGSLYESEQWREYRDAGFSIFYISVNVGAFFGSLFTGLAQSELGFHYGFGLAAIGMAFGLWRYQRGRHLLRKTPAPNPLPPGQGRYYLAGAILFALFVLTMVLTGVLNARNLGTVVLVIGMVAIVIYFAYLLLSPSFTPAERRHVVAYVPMFIGGVVFWILWEQFYSALTVYFDETVDRNIGGFTVPVAWGGSLQSLWVILFAGLLARLWMKMGDRQPRTPMKYALAQFFMAACFYCFTLYTEAGVPMSLAMYAFAIWILTIAELLCSPIGSSFITKIAPERFRTQMVALYFLSIALGSTAGGKLFELYYDAKAPADYYWLLTCLCLGAGVVLLALTPVLNRAFRDVD